MSSTTIQPSFTLLYVASPEESAAFYGRLLGLKPVELAPTFALFVLDSGFKLGFWRRPGVEPAVTAPAGGSELCFAVADRDAVDARCFEWRGLGLQILQPPTALDFGYTFTAVDADGHRMRVFTPEDAQA